MTLMDGAEMVGRMANQVFLIYMFNSFATFVKVRRPNRFDFMMLLQYDMNIEYNNYKIEFSCFFLFLLSQKQFL